MKTIAWTLAASVVVGACASAPVPAGKLAQSEAAIQSAEVVGAESVPPAALHLSVAKDALARAKKLMSEGDNTRAGYVLLRAEADAEVAISLAREASARAEAQKTLDEVRMLKTNRPEGT